MPPQLRPVLFRSFIFASFLLLLIACRDTQAAPTLVIPDATPKPAPALTSFPTATPLTIIPPNCDNVTEIPASECAALLTIYIETGGADWTGDISGTTVDWFSSESPCSWSGITCENERVTILQLKRRNLVGALPAAIGELTELVDIQIYQNSLTGEIPAAFFTLEKLRTADLSNNKFEGEIPVDFGRIPTLEALNLNYNNFSGNLPFSLIEAPRLGWLDVSFNQLSGPLDPAFLELAYFNYEGNNLIAP